MASGIDRPGRPKHSMVTRSRASRRYLKLASEVFDLPTRISLRVCRKILPALCRNVPGIDISALGGWLAKRRMKRKLEEGLGHEVRNKDVSRDPVIIL